MYKRYPLTSTNPITVMPSKIFRKENIIILFFVLVSAAIRLYGLTSQSLWYDEGTSLTVSGENTISETINALATVRGSERYQPLYFILLHLWRNVFGSTEIALRLLSVLFGALSIPFLIKTANKVGNHYYSLTVSTLYAISAFSIFFSQEVRPYSFLIFITSIQLWSITNILFAQDNSSIKKYYIYFWISSGISMAASIFSALFLVSLSLSHIILFRSIKKWLLLWMPSVIFCIPGISYYIYSAIILNSGSISVSHNEQSIILNFLYVIYGLTVGLTYGPSIEQLRSGVYGLILREYSFELILLALTCTIFISLLIRHIYKSIIIYKSSDLLCKWTIFIISTFGLSLVFMAIFSIGTHLNWLPRHSYFSFLPLLLILPLLLNSLSRPTNGPVNTWIVYKYTTITCIIGLCIFNVIANYNYFLKYPYARDDYKNVAIQLKKISDSNSKSVMVWGNIELLNYYGVQGVIDGRKVNVHQLSSEIERITSKADKVIIVVNRPYYWDGDVSELDRSRYSYEWKRKYQNFDLYCFRHIQDRPAHLSAHLNFPKK